MSRQLTVYNENKPCYDIWLEKDYSRLGELFEVLDLQKRKICIVTDSTVGPLYIGDVIGIAKDYASVVETFTFDAGEQSKNLDTVSDLYELLIKSHFDRKDILIALGGGVVGDLTGFAAASYLRGIRFIQMPTSLLAMVDSSIGGKTGVDFRGYKNMIGAFKQPTAIYMNLSVLATLTDAQYFSGYGEIIKHGYIKDSDYLVWIEEHTEALKQKELSALEEVIYRSCQIKKTVVENDPTEKGERALLNFGHTLGHAIEKLMNFSMLHGECVTIGLHAAAYISYKRGYISKAELEQVAACLTGLYLPVRLEKSLSADEIIRVSKSDKKMDGEYINFILLKEVGHAIMDKSVTEDEMRDALHYIGATE